MASAPQTYWVVAVPNTTPVPDSESKEEKDQRLARTRKKLHDAAVKGASGGLCQMFDFNIPPLKVGTIDSLMALSDELTKYDTTLYQLVQRIDRSFSEIYSRDAEEADRSEGKGEARSSDSKTAKAPQLLVNNETPEEYVRHFNWNSVRYPHKRATLRAMVEQIVKDSTKADNDLKRQMGEYTEVRTAVQSIERKETGSLMVRPLGQYVKREDMIDREFLTSLLLVIPKAKYDEFLTEYETLEDSWREREKKELRRRAEEAQTEIARKKAKDAEDNKRAAAAAAATAPTTTGHHEDHEVSAEEVKKNLEQERIREAELKAQIEAKQREQQEAQKRKEKEQSTRNIVPGSARKLADDADFVLVRILVLRKGLDTFKAICRDRRWTIRDFKYDPEQDATNKAQLIKLEKHKKKLYEFLTLWCKSTYSEVFAAWIHVKAMRCFVESVLRYGLPVNFAASLLLPVRGADKKLREVLKQLYGNLANANLTSSLDAGETDLSGFGSDFFPYVYMTLSLGDVL